MVFAIYNKNSNNRLRLTTDSANILVFGVLPSSKVI